MFSARPSRTCSRASRVESAAASSLWSIAVRYRVDEMAGELRWTIRHGGGQRVSGLAVQSGAPARGELLFERLPDQSMRKAVPVDTGLRQQAALTRRLEQVEQRIGFSLRH